MNLLLRTAAHKGRGLRNAGRLNDAVEYARPALRNFETYGQAAAADIQRTQQLLAMIERRMG